MSQRPTGRSVRVEETEELGRVLSQLFALRGYGQPRANRELHDAWRQCAGGELAGCTRVVTYRNGVLKVAVGNSALLGELTGYRKAELLQTLSRDFPRLRIRDLKFQLRTNLPARD